MMEIPSKILLMAEIRRENQLRLVVYPIFYKVSYIPGGWEGDFSHQQLDTKIRWSPNTLETGP